VERRKKRQELLEATERRLQKVADTVKSGKLKRQASIGLRVGKVIGRFKVGKLFGGSRDRQREEVSSQARSAIALGAVER